MASQTVTITIATKSAEAHSTVKGMHGTLLPRYTPPRQAKQTRTHGACQAPYLYSYPCRSHPKKPYEGFEEISLLAASINVANDKSEKHKRLEEGVERAVVGSAVLIAAIRMGYTVYS